MPNDSALTLELSVVHVQELEQNRIHVAGPYFTTMFTSFPGT